MCLDISLGRGEVAILRDDMVKGELEANVAPWTPALGASLVDGLACLAWGWEGKPM